MKNLILGVAIIVFGFSFAQQKEDWNLKSEKKRTAQGIKSGEINKKEAAKIHKEMKDVKQAENKAVADGVITPKERAKVAIQDKQLDKTIYKAKHNHR